MRNGITAGTLAPSLPYAVPVTQAATIANFFPSVAYAIFWRETISGEVEGLWRPFDAATVVSADGGHGLGQITSLPIPPNWADPYTNALWSIENFMLPAETYWARELQGDDLVRAIAAEYNAGRARAIQGHEEGDIGKYTTNGYPQAVLGFYTNILATGKPT